MVVVVVTFALCWLPYHVYFILGSFNIDIYKQHYIQQVSSFLSVVLASPVVIYGMYYGFISRCIWPFSGWQWAQPCTTPLFTAVWTKGEVFIHSEKCCYPKISENVWKSFFIDFVQVSDTHLHGVLSSKCLMRTRWNCSTRTPSGSPWRAATTEIARKPK